MYATCLYCHHGLGSNDQLEALPVGKRVAFDAAKGRLWVVCPSCGRWNLAPLDERWEAIEQCERLFRGTRIRVSTDNIGLAKLRDGTELVRVGEPLRPEFAAWRYTDQIVRRRRRALVVGAVTTTGIVASVTGVGIGLGVGGGAWWVYNLLNGVRKQVRNRRIVHRIEQPGGPLVVRHGDLWRLEWRPPAEAAPARLILHPEAQGQSADTGVTFNTKRYLPPVASLEGDSAVHLAAVALASLNRTDGSKEEIREAVDWIDVYGNPFVLDPASGARDAEERSAYREGQKRRRPGRSGDLEPFLRSFPLAKLRPYQRLAFEIAAQEEQERLFLSAHLSVLEHAWKEAEEIAAIADDLLLPDWIRDRIGG
jgi:hypothetical protein